MSDFNFIYELREISRISIQKKGNQNKETGKRRKELALKEK